MKRSTSRRERISSRSPSGELPRRRRVSWNSSSLENLSRSFSTAWPVSASLGGSTPKRLASTTRSLSLITSWSALFTGSESAAGRGELIGRRISGGAKRTRYRSTSVKKIISSLTTAAICSRTAPPAGSAEQRGAKRIAPLIKRSINLRRKILIQLQVQNSPNAGSALGCFGSGENIVQGPAPPIDEGEEESQ